MNTKNILYLFFGILISSHAHAAPKPLDHIVAVVNTDVITNLMLQSRVNDFRKQLALSQLSRIDPETLKKQVLERMIRDTIQLQKAKQFGITVDDLTLNRMLEQLAKTNNMSLEVFRDTIENEGLDFFRFREQTREEVIIQKLQQRIIVSRINVSDQEIQQHIKQNELVDSSKISYHLRHILIATPEAAKPEDIKIAAQKAESIYSRIQQGDQFEDLAIKKSAGRNALKGGDLGPRKANELPQLFVDAVIELKPGETSKPVRSASGFHLLYLISSSNHQLMVNQLRVRHILMRPGIEGSDEQTRQALLKLKQEIEAGRSFAELASEHSEDPSSKIKGGDLGWVAPGDFAPAFGSTFESVANSLTTGQLSEPFKTPFGWHLIEVLEHRQYDQAKSNKTNEARNAIQKRKADEELRLWLRRIRAEAFVEYIVK